MIVHNISLFADHNRLCGRDRYRQEVEGRRQVGDWGGACVRAGIALHHSAWLMWCSVTLDLNARLVGLPCNWSKTLCLVILRGLQLNVLFGEEGPFPVGGR